MWKPGRSRDFEAQHAQRRFLSHRGMLACRCCRQHGALWSNGRHLERLYWPTSLHAEVSVWFCQLCTVILGADSQQQAKQRQIRPAHQAGV